MNIRNKRHMDQTKVFAADTELELVHGLDKGGRFDVADCSAELWKGEGLVYVHIGEERRKGVRKGKVERMG